MRPSHNASRVRSSAVGKLEGRCLLATVAAGAEFRANTWTTGRQEQAAVAADAEGNFVVVWRGSSSRTGDGVLAQR